jgi:hypothetical protein
VKSLVDVVDVAPPARAGEVGQADQRLLGQVGEPCAIQNLPALQAGDAVGGDGGRCGFGERGARGRSRRLPLMRASETSRSCAGKLRRRTG